MATYIRNIRQYFEWCEFSFGNAPLQLYRANVLEYISYMRNLKGYSPKSVNNHLSALRCLNEFLIAEGTQTETVILKTDFMKVQLQYASPCTVEKRDVDAFRQRLLESGSKRDYAIVILYAYSELRRTECVGLLLEQVDLVSKEIRVVGKGDKQRLVYINDKIVHAIREYLKERRSESPYLFVSRQSGKCATIQTAILLHTTSRWLTVPYSPSIKIWRSLPSQTIFLTISLIKVRFSSIVSVWKLSLKLDNAVDSISS